MLRSIWKGAISFGLVNIPVRLYAATKSHDLKFSYLHKECNTPLHYERNCPACSEAVSGEDMVRGYEYEKGHWVVLDEQDFEKLPLPTTKAIELLDFVQLSEIDPIYFERSYYLEPDQVGVRAYALLRAAMEETGKAAVAKVALRSRESLGAVRVLERTLVLETMFYPDEIRSQEQLEGVLAEPELPPRELAMAVDLVRNLSASFEPRKYKDDYKDALSKLVESRIQGKAVEEVRPPMAGKVVDLMEALEASVKATAGRSGQARSRPRDISKLKRTSPAITTLSPAARTVPPQGRRLRPPAES